MRYSTRIIFLLMFGFEVLFTSTVKGQSITSDKVSLSLNNESLETAIKRIEQQSAFRFFYRNTDIEAVAHLNLAEGIRTIEQTLEDILRGSDLYFRQMDGNILLERKSHGDFADMTGRVLNAADKRPIPNASIFLSNATIGGSTTANGTFSLQHIKQGKYNLVVSVVGFESYSQTITVNNTNAVVPDIMVLPRVIALGEVTIKAAGDPEWKRNYNLFKREFLGTSALADECKIINPEILDFDYNDTTQTLIAKTNELLVVENHALGYKIKYLLTSFKYQPGNDQLKLHYDGSAFFEAMKGTDAQMRRWQKQRQKVYEGSEMQFLRSSLSGRTDEDGFRIMRLERCNNPDRPCDSLLEAKISYFKKKGKRDSLAFWRKQEKLPKMLEKLSLDPLTRERFINSTDQPGMFAFGPGNSYDAFYISYNKYHKFFAIDWQARIDARANMSSTLVNFKSPYAFFDQNGGVVNPSSLALSGVWSYNRIAELLPVDYEPAQNRAVKSGGVIIANNDAPKTPPTTSLKADLLKLKTISDSTNATRPAERLYLQFDKPYYAVNDTIWFKGYLFKASYLTASDKSGLLYIDIANDSSKIVKQFSVPVRAGFSWGNIGLDEKEFLPGTYTVKAYTKWMRNFGDDFFFTKSFYIAAAGESNWLVNKQIKTSAKSGNDTAFAKMQFTDFNQKPATGEVMQLQIADGNKTLFKQAVKTDANGLLDINFKIPAKSSGITLVAENGKEGKKAVIPIQLNRPQNTDIQFLPEGGSLVAGLPAHIGFKAIGEDGKGINIEGIITDHNQKQVSTFQSQHNGIGSFNLTVQDGEIYTAKVALPDGGSKEYPLPAVKSNGMILNVKNPMESDSLEVFIAATNDVIQTGDSYFLIGKARGIVCYGAIVNFQDGNYVKKKIAKSLFPTGITHFTIMSAKYQPVNERLVYIDRHDNLQIKIAADKPIYAARDSVTVKLKVADGEGDPVAGNFSVAVTDDAQVGTDTLKNENILSRTLLTADLQGYIEDPGYYFATKTPEAWQALDNLILTQGWIGYNWTQVFNPPLITFASEKQLEVNGSVLNVFNKPVKKTDVLLFSKTPAILMDTVTDANGRFVFDRFPPIDTPVFIVRAVNHNGKSFNVGITMDETPPPVFKRQDMPVAAPWYVNSDSTLLNYTHNKALLTQQEYHGQGHLLREVKITAKKTIKDSQNVNGTGNADLVLDERDMENAKKKNWLQLFQENFKGLNAHYDRGASGYFINYRVLRIIIDGAELTPALVKIYAEVSTDAIVNLNYYLEGRDAEDIKGIEMNYSSKYSFPYVLRYGGEPEVPYVFVEITTRGGHGPYLDHTPGVYLYKPVPVSLPKQFYKPKYAVKDTTNHNVDLRSTIDWEPNIVTNKNGEAKFSFYTADKPSTYTIIINGADMAGSVGFKTGKIKVEQPTTSTK